MLTPKERLRMILAGQQADRPACICPGGMMNMVTSELMDRVKVYMPEAHRDARQMAELAKAVYTIMFMKRDVSRIMEFPSA